MAEYVDVIVPRGGKGLIARISNEARVPVIKHLDGICHVYVDDKADPDKAVRVAFNAKAQRFGTCNTMETLLVAGGIAERVLPPLCEKLREKGVELRGCERTRAIIPYAVPATAEDWDTEYLAPILSIRVVEGLDQAIDHIERHGSRHTDAIITEDLTRARRFLTEVDSSSVMVNASTRFADGFEYGLGADQHRQAACPWPRRPRRSDVPEVHRAGRWACQDVRGESKIVGRAWSADRARCRLPFANCSSHSTAGGRMLTGHALRFTLHPARLAKT